MADRERFHEGEIAVQQRAGERGLAVRHGSMLLDAIPRPARTFLATQRTLALGTLDAIARPWATLWSGPPGFVTSGDGRAVRVALDGQLPAPDDPLPTLLRPGRSVGMLAIDLGSRRRLRINGVVAAADEHHLEVAVREAFPNCPKYIQRREPIAAAATALARAAERGVRLDGERRSTLERADTLFVASSHPTRGVDVSHRGGTPGFVRVVDERTLHIPDYPGNGMFLTLGNFEVVPRAGLLAVDFERRRLLALTGSVTLSHGAEDPGHSSGGTGRYWTFVVDEWLDFTAAVGFGYRFIEPSPFSPLPFDPHDAGPPPQQG